MFSFIEKVPSPVRHFGIGLLAVVVGYVATSLEHLTTGQFATLIVLLVPVLRWLSLYLTQTGVQN